MKYSKIAKVLVVMLMVQGCNGQNKSDSKNKDVSAQNAKTTIAMDNNEIKEFIELQSKVETEETEYDNPYKLSKKDLEVEEKLVVAGLKNNGFKTISKELFEQKIKTIFGVNLDNNNCTDIDVQADYVTLFGNRMDGKKETLLKNQYDLPYVNQNVFLSRKNNFLFEAHLLREFVDPLAANYRVKLPTYLVARNMYLFNDSRAHYKWLTLNDTAFMESLVKRYGYTEDKELLKWVVEKSFPSSYEALPDDGVYDKIAPLLFTKNCDGGIEVHQNIFEVLASLSTPKSNKYIMYVAEYLQHGLCLGCDKDAVKHYLSFAEEAKLAAYILEFGEQYKYDKSYGYNQMFLGNFYYYTDSDKKYINEFKKNNFYGLTKLKSWYEAAAKEPDMFRENNFDDNPQPQNYLDRAS